MEREWQASVPGVLSPIIFQHEVSVVRDLTSSAAGEGRGPRREEGESMQQGNVVAQRIAHFMVQPAEFILANGPGSNRCSLTSRRYHVLPLQRSRPGPSEDKATWHAVPTNDATRVCRHGRANRRCTVAVGNPVGGWPPEIWTAPRRSPRRSIGWAGSGRLHRECLVEGIRPMPPMTMARHAMMGRGAPPQDLASAERGPVVQRIPFVSGRSTG